MRPALFLILVCFTATQVVAAEPAIVQQVLKDRNFHFGEISGQWDEETAAAIRRYQIRTGLPVTGEADAETLSSLGINPDGSVDQSTPSVEQEAPTFAGTESDVRPEPSSGTGRAAEGRSTPSQSADATRKDFLAMSPYATADPALRAEAVRWVQGLLRNAGYYRGAIDALPGPQTRRAMAAFQADHNLPVSGLLDGQTFHFLEASSTGATAANPAGAVFSENVPAYQGRQVFRGVRVR